MDLSQLYLCYSIILEESWGSIFSIIIFRWLYYVTHAPVAFSNRATNSKLIQATATSRLDTVPPCTVAQWAGVWAVDATLLLSKKWPWSAGKQQLFANEVHSEHPSCPCTKKISGFEAQSAWSFASYRRSILTCRSPPSNNNVTTVSSFYILNKVINKWG